jgi:hypothetical protein
LALLSECEAAHSDLRTENILLKVEGGTGLCVADVKLVGYESSFEFRDIAQFSMALSAGYERLSQS